jgi:hypothetical protein
MKHKSTIYLQKASFNSLGYIAESAEQRELCKQITMGASVSSDSPDTQWSLYNLLRPYLQKNASLVSGSELPMHHALEEVYRTRSEGTIMLNQSLGWVTIEMDSKGKDYLENLLRDWKMSVDVSQEAYGG